MFEALSGNEQACMMLEQSLMRWHCRPYNSRIVPDTTIPFVCAYSFSNSPAIAYHGGNRFVGAFNIYCPDEE